jgi:hypothetical protein
MVNKKVYSGGQWSWVSAVAGLRRKARQVKHLRRFLPCPLNAEPSTNLVAA